MCKHSPGKKRTISRGLHNTLDFFFFFFFKNPSLANSLWITLSSSRKTSEFIFAEVRNLEQNSAELYHTVSIEGISSPKRYMWNLDGQPRPDRIASRKPLKNHQQKLVDIYCAISFNSARVVTRDPKHRFGTSATNEVWHATCKNSAQDENFRKFFLFCTSEGDLALMSRILHSALGAVTCDRDQNSSRHKGCVTRDRRIE
jgi:hypothetical protein